jgi:UrcA family protein
MNKNLRTLVAIGAAVGAGLAAAGAARADSAAETAAGWIVVVAPHVDHQVARKGKNTTEVMTITHRVEVADLDLTMYADVKELEKRIADKAKVACEQLAALYPTANPDIPGCVRDAVANAMEQAEQLIAVVNKKP